MRICHFPKKITIRLVLFFLFTVMACNISHAASTSGDPRGSLPPVDGVCGSANGVPALSAPTANLCGTGTASPVDGSGPWTWSCAGAGGTTAQCSAPLSPLLTLSSTSPLFSTITSTDIQKFPFLTERCFAPFDPITSAQGITPLTQNINAPTKVLFMANAEINPFCTYVNNPRQAYYWGRIIGADGMLFMFPGSNYSVGYDITSMPYQLVKLAQSNYATYGVSQNFLQINLENVRQGVNWTSSTWRSQMIENIKEDTALAKYAGFKGPFFDFENMALWGKAYDPTIPNKGQIIEQFGYNLGTAIFSEMPNAQIAETPQCGLTDPSTLPSTSPARAHGYYYFPEFCWGFIHARLNYPNVYFVFAVQNTYSQLDPNIVTEATNTWWKNNTPLLNNLGIPLNTVSLAPGLWPLGDRTRDANKQLEYWPNGWLVYNRLAKKNHTPAGFQGQLDQAFSFKQNEPYVWVFDNSAPWELTDPNAGPLPIPYDYPDPLAYFGPLDPNFKGFINAIHTVKLKYKQ